MSMFVIAVAVQGLGEVGAEARLRVFSLVSSQIAGQHGRGCGLGDVMVTVTVQGEVGAVLVIRVARRRVDDRSWGSTRVS
jgi:hypothetical protein